MRNTIYIYELIMSLFADLPLKIVSSKDSSLTLWNSKKFHHKNLIVDSRASL